MKPAPFDYHDPHSAEEVVTVLAARGDDADVLAGGQSLVPLLNLRLARPAVVLDLRRLPTEAPTIADGTVQISATVTVTNLLAAAVVGSLGEGVVEALRMIGHPQIRNRGTVVGSIAHADPAVELPAVLLALDGVVALRSRSRERRVPAADFFDGPFSTARQADDLLTSAALPVFARRRPSTSPDGQETPRSSACSSRSWRATPASRRSALVTGRCGFAARRKR
jgi:carbon-monoxide dehydrogenase medium subunit